MSGELGVSVELIWALVLMLVGLGLVVLELFIPSGGILGFLATIAVVVSVVLGFMSSPGHGVMMLVANVIVVPAVVALMFKWWPHTPMGRRVLLDVPDEEQLKPHDPELEALKKLRGRVARAHSPMLPSGAIEIDGQIYDALSEGVPIDPGQLVRIVEVQGNRVVVRPLDEQELQQLSQEQRSEEDLLSQDISELGLDLDSPPEGPQQSS